MDKHHVCTKFRFLLTNTLDGYYVYKTCRECGGYTTLNLQHDLSTKKFEEAMVILAEVAEKIYNLER